MKSPQPRRSTSVTLLFDILITLAAPLIAIYYVAMTFSHLPIKINLFGLVLVAAVCAWFADVERRRRWLRTARDKAARDR